MYWLLLFKAIYAITNVETNFSNFSNIHTFFKYVDQLFDNIVTANTDNATIDWVDGVAKSMPSIIAFLSGYSMFIWVINLFIMLMMLFSFLCAFIKSCQELLMFNP